jgi:VIT1/CCC1 family predicted Fe2+/Mn2+ transporter
MSRLEVLNNVESREQQLSLTDNFQDIASKTGAPYNTRYLTLPSTLPQRPDAVREALRKYLHKSLSWTKEEIRLRGNDYYQGRPPTIYSSFVDRLARFIMAFVGGAALLIPMAIMVFNSSLNKSLITTCVAVILFAGFLAFGISASNQDTLAATATYAAVLVVFVGTSLPPGTPGA